MPVIEIRDLPGFEAWRLVARQCLQARIPPEEMVWRIAGPEQTLSLSFELPEFEKPADSMVTVPAEFIALAKVAACHRDSERFGLLYRILWRLVFENRNLLHYQTDDDILQLTQRVKAVNRDAYKIKAFLRFREIGPGAESQFVSWYEPEHYSLELALPFFQTRFKNMCWSILTPYRAAHWDGDTLTLSDNPDSSLYPAEDQIESYWLTYYANTFNPARIKTKAMLSQMPKKYWKNMPETALVETMLQQANQRVEAMISLGQKPV